MRLTHQQWKTQTGFTLMELIVAAGIFVIVLTMMLGILVSARKAQRRLDATRALQSDMASALHTISRAVAFGKIDFASLGSAYQSPLSTLPLRDEKDVVVIFTTLWSGENGPACQRGESCFSRCQDGQTQGCVFFARDREFDSDSIVTPEEYTYLTPHTLRVDPMTGLLFHLLPPNTTSPTAQPQVTITFTASSTAVPSLSLTLQSTVVSRYYSVDDNTSGASSTGGGSTGQNGGTSGQFGSGSYSAPSGSYSQPYEPTR